MIHRPGKDGPPRRRPRGYLLPQGAASTGDAPPIASSQSPLSSVSACGENCARSLAPPLQTARARRGREKTRKRECAATLEEKKFLRRSVAKLLRLQTAVILKGGTERHQGGNAPAAPRRSPWPKSSPWVPAATWTARTGHDRRSPATRQPSQRRYRSGTLDGRSRSNASSHPDDCAPSPTAVEKIAEGPSVPEGQPKSEAPIRRPSSRAEGHCTGARLAAFSFGPCTARFLFRKAEKKMGGASPDKPPCGSNSLAAATAAHPTPSCGRHICPPSPRPAGRPSLPLRQGKFFEFTNSS